MKLVLPLLLAAAALWPRVAHAAEIAPEHAPCDDAVRLAGLVQAEAFSQPAPAHIAIAEIVVNEAASRSMTVCELSERTDFTTIWHYAMAHPRSWTARQLSSPETWALAIASDALDGRLPDETGGAGHFDGVASAADLFTIGEVHFSR